MLGIKGMLPSLAEVGGLCESLAPQKLRSASMSSIGSGVLLWLLASVTSSQSI